MAARDNQGLQAAVIVLTLLVLGLGVGFFVATKAKNTAQARALAAETSRNQESEAAAKLSQQANSYKVWMGFAEGDGHDTIAARVMGDQGDLTIYGGAADEANRNYHSLLLGLVEENQKLALNESTTKQELRQVKESLLAVEKQKEEQVNEYRKQRDAAVAEAAARKTQFDEQYANINELNAKLAKEMQEAQALFDKEKAELQSQRAELEQNIRSLGSSITKLKEGLPKVDEFAQPSDGKITWVNQRQGKVWIDLGAADGMRPQVTFSVSNSLDADAEKSEKKGSIEVTRVIDDHMSEAKITFDSATNPLIPGDKIYSQVWDRGRKVGFGIAGFVDIDGDGTSDLDQLRRIITASNGRVDAAPDAEGRKEGEMRIDSRFLVLGEYPSDPLLSDAYLASWESINDEAEQLGVETVPLQEFLKLMGWQSDTKAARLGSAGKASDFPAEAKGQELPRKTRTPQGIFKKRLPAVGY